MYLTSPDEAECEQALEQLLVQKIAPIVCAVLRRKLRVSMQTDDESPRNVEGLEIHMDVQAHLLGLFNKLKGAGGNPIKDLEPYVRTVAANAFRQYLRKKYPLRLRLKNKILYIFRHRAGLAIWSGPSGETVCGRPEWWENAPVRMTNPPDLQQEQRPRRGSSIDDNREILSLIENVLTNAGAPVMLDDLTAIVLMQLGLSDPSETGLSVDDNFEAKDNAKVIADRFALQEFWILQRRLSLDHRKALLLNLRDTAGDNLLAFLPVLRIASIREIASSLEMAAEDLAEIWDQLPLDDNRLAERMSLKRQQVINLRQSARAQLRRMRDELK